jgi:CRISPR/Cas system-associated exonuclease Cas4 (RecB family)
MAVDYIDNNWDDNASPFSNLKEWEELLKEARTAHRKKKEKAGDWGTAVHLAIEEWIKFKKEEPELDEIGINVFNKFRAWAEENSVKFLESEKHLWSEKMWTGGIVDLVIEMQGKRYIADIKTSSGIYNEAFFQMAAYDLMLKEMGEGKDIEGYIVINLKKDGTMDMKMATDMEMNQQAFLSALSLYKIINNLKK